MLGKVFLREFSIWEVSWETVRMLAGFLEGGWGCGFLS
jgi:hypothetical protein